MNRAGDRSVRPALRSQRQLRTQQQVSVQKKKDAPRGCCSTETQSGLRGSDADVKPAGKESSSSGAQRKLSDASNASEDLSKDSGCVSGKLSSSDSSSEMSDCPSEGNKLDSPTGDTEWMWTHGRVYEAPSRCAAAADSGAAGAELVMAQSTEDLVRELDELRSENEYLKDEAEELRCEMLEMRDMFQEEELFQLQELRLQLEQANKTCRVLQYRLRKAERRSIRVAQTGQVDGELVRSLEHDVRASVKKKSIRSSATKAERRVSQQIEDDSAELRCQLHFAKEELVLMCKKLTKLVLEGEGMREELAKYRSAYGDVDAKQSPEGKHNSAHAREAEVKVHLKLVEEEATLLSRRIVELEVENHVDWSGKAQKVFLPGPFNEALELLRDMLSSFIGRVETLLTGQDLGQNPFHKDGHVWDPCTSSFLSGDVESVEDLRASEVKERATRRAPSVHSDPKMQLSLQILWILHQWCQVKGPGLEGKEGKDKTMSVLRGLLQDVAAELRDERIEIDSGAKATQDKAAECPVTGFLLDDRPCEAGRICSSKEKKPKRAFSPRDSKRKNWSCLSRAAAQLDREEPAKTWDHPIMPLSFPDLDFEQMSVERSHTAPEKSAVRIYFSPPSARRVQLAQAKQSPVADGESVDTSSPWCTPPTSLSALCLGSSANLSDDVKEMKAGWRQAVYSSSQEKGRRSVGRWVDVACSGTQTHMKPQMVSVGLQTDVGPVRRSSPSRALSSSLVTARSHHISTSLDGVERPRTSTSSPKLYRRHSGASSLPSTPSVGSSSSSRDRALWNLNHQSGSGVSSWTRQTSQRQSAAQSPGSLSSAKPPTKPAGANRYGLVTEFLRRVSGRAEKPVSGSGPKTKSGPKNLERVPTRPPVAALHRTDSVTRIVNQRFMKQRDEKSGVLNPGVRHSVSVSPEDGTYDCSSGSTLTFCFARPCRSAQRQTSNQSKVLRHTHSPPVGSPSGCEGPGGGAAAGARLTR
ncbi:DUF3166 domain containing protein [Scophthalmus maximus]|uniref:DUF3166 domain containing protein n=1 Tax=Scophthalmus maximus TaxID=52904 RepID=A0A2U9C1B6_SCOMX|nr:DUF3166 domain containing protein [Scophthalmus maximus]